MTGSETRAEDDVASPVAADPITSTFRYAVVKRLLDILVGATTMVLLSPLLLTLMIVVRTSSPGPVFYRWNVIGKCGRPFRSYKLRTMVDDADALKHQMEQLNEMKGPVFKVANDPRITRVGRLLRKYSLDELPQLWSVLKGDMSLVGPRPMLESEWAACSGPQRRKLTVTPGMTCIWQVKGRNTISDFSAWVQLDLAYIDTWSLRSDLRILAQTIGAVWRGTGR